MQEQRSSQESGFFCEIGEKRKRQKENLRRSQEVVPGVFGTPEPHSDSVPKRGDLTEHSWPVRAATERSLGVLIDRNND